MLIISIGCILIILIIAWSISNVYKEGFVATCTNKSINVGVDTTTYELKCESNEYLSQMTPTDKGYDYTCCTDSNMQGPRGEQGLKGDSASDGEPGTIGPIGNAGPIGPKGDTGPIGPIGNIGTQRGDKGPKGSTGEMGPIGPKGEQGKVEATEPSGPLIPGPKGPMGPSGEKGLTGPAGDDAPGSDVPQPKQSHLTKLEKVQLYLIKMLAKKRPLQPTSRLNINIVEDDTENVMQDATSAASATSATSAASITNDTNSYCEDNNTSPSCAQGKEYNSNTYKQSM